MLYAAKNKWQGATSREGPERPATPILDRWQVQQGVAFLIES